MAQDRSHLRKGRPLMAMPQFIVYSMENNYGIPAGFEMASTLFDDTAPSARLVPPGARAAPTYPRAQPGQLGSLRWPLLARLSLLRR